ncbi:MAG: S41 family peptidase [Cyclobacteriaceae bacterium]
MLVRRTLFIKLFILLSFINQGFAQGDSCSCTTDLNFLHDKIKKTPSYKSNKADYLELYSKTAKEATNLSSGYDCFVLLNKLMLALNDNHCNLYGTDKGATSAVKNDPDQLSEFKNSALFKSYPKPKINLDSLKGILASQQEADIEGIYALANYLTIGVFEDKKEKNYQAIVLDSYTEVWNVGEIIYNLVRYGNDFLLSIGGDLYSKRLISYTEKIEDGIFLTMGFQKDTSKTNFSRSMYADSLYVRREISPEITYLKIGSFNSWYPALSDAEAFYQSLENKLTKKNLIIDLRDNGGGGDRNSDILFKLLKDYVKSNNLFVLINHRTASNAEQFAYKLSQFENCTTFGHRTNGTAAYEILDSTYDLPCDNFVVVLTSKKHSKYINLESEGLAPDVKFTMDADWIDQLLAHIERQK